MTGPYLVRHLERATWAVRLPGATASYLLTPDRAEIARFSDAEEARAACPDGRPVLSGCRECGKHADEFVGCDCDGARVVSVKAFETLVSARDYARRALRATGADLASDLLASLELATLPAEGGKVELPDGSEIVVEATTLGYLASQIPADRRVDAIDRGILAAFNAAMAERYGTEAR